jgi:hypothetical protein
MAAGATTSLINSPIGISGASLDPEKPAAHGRKPLC